MQAEPSSGGPRRRMSAESRRIAILDRASEAFAAEGFALSTREIALRCGVTQALLYKHFASKEALVEAVLQHRFLHQREGPDPALLNGNAPLPLRIGAFYAAFAQRADPVNIRLFLRAAMDGLNLPRRYASRLDERLLCPVLSTLREEIGAPPLTSPPLPPLEREIVMSIHAAMVFTLIRRDIYRIRFPIPLEELVMAEARIWTPGAVQELRNVIGQDITG
jgi:AcrR family transcriptional regulator